MIAPWKLEIGGVLIGDGTAYELVAFSGLAGLPSLRSDDVPRDGHDGVHVALDTVDARVVTVSVEVWGVTADEAFAAAGVLGAACAPGDTVLRWQMPGQAVRRATVRPRMFEVDAVDASAQFGSMLATVQLVAPDPRMYADVLSTHQWTIAVDGTSGQSTFTVGGNYGTRPTVTIQGPARNPRVTFDDGRALRVDVDVEVGSSLVVDVAAKTVTLDGVPRFDAVRADNEWPELTPGSNTLVFSRSSTALTGASSTITVDWRDAWMS